jgi:hypothetical protein
LFNIYLLYFFKENWTLGIQIQSTSATGTIDEVLVQAQDEQFHLQWLEDITNEAYRMEDVAIEFWWQRLFGQVC